MDSPETMFIKAVVKSQVFEVVNNQYKSFKIQCCSYFNMTIFKRHKSYRKSTFIKNIVMIHSHM